MTILPATDQSQVTATGDLFSPSLTGFAKQFAAFDTEIMAELGEHLKLTSENYETTLQSQSVITRQGARQIRSRQHIVG